MHPQHAPEPPLLRPKWARKRIALPALFTALLLGAAMGGSGNASSPVQAAAAKPAPTVTVTTTATASPKPAPTVTVTKKVKVAETVVDAPEAEVASESDSGDDGGGFVYYANCSEARAAGAAPLYRGDPGYAAHLDRDGDGDACE